MLASSTIRQSYPGQDQQIIQKFIEPILIDSTLIKSKMK